jgi:tRNA threonylcarbamoyladenosine biosynthesis protein TsaB
MGWTLALESIARSGSVAAVADDGACLAMDDLGGADAAGALVPALQAMLERFERPDRIAVANGPGSFTGLRIAVVAARTLAWTDDLPICAVDSTAAAALAAGPGTWAVCLSLKRDVTFVACHRISAAAIDTVLPVAAYDDAGPAPHLPPEAGVTGPALEAKATVIDAWWPDRLRQAASLDALAVGRAARWSPSIPWQELAPAYHRASAPELQRARGVS